MRLYEAVVVGMAVLNLLVIQVWCLEKIAEAGMLKAIGMTWWQLVKLVVTETGLLWAAAVTWACPAGFWPAGLSSAGNTRPPLKLPQGFQFTGWPVAVVWCRFLRCALPEPPGNVTWHVSSPSRLLRSE